jgi:hypothetical protein
VEFIHASESVAAFQPHLATMERVASEFNVNWRTKLSMLNTLVMQQFPTFSTSTFVLQAILSKLLVYYSKFYQAMQQPSVKLQTKTIPIDLQTVMVEIKKFKASSAFLSES